MLRNNHDIDVLRESHIIGMTVTGATMRANLLGNNNNNNNNGLLTVFPQIKGGSLSVNK